MNAYNSNAVELSLGEIDLIAGGPIALAPLLPYIVPVVTAAIGAVAGYVTANSNDDCTTRTTTVTNGNTTRTVTSVTCD